MMYRYQILKMIPSVEAILLLTVISSSHATAIITEKTWATASVTDITAIESSSTQAHSVSAPSLVYCLGAALALSWTRIACYYPSLNTNQCTLWGEGAYYLTNITIQPEGAPADCRVKNSTNSKLLKRRNLTLSKKIYEKI